MGCVLCNITSCQEFVQGESLPAKNPFYCEPGEALEHFLDELAYDIATSHPEMVKKINQYVVKLHKPDSTLVQHYGVNLVKRRRS